MAKLLEHLNYFNKISSLLGRKVAINPPVLKYNNRVSKFEVLARGRTYHNRSSFSKSKQSGGDKNH